MKNLSGSEIRKMFLDYFKSNGHMVEPGASLVPHNDPTLLWINSGVAALKKYFDGTIKPANNRITNAQKSIRTNDIENVGRTARHHTFFEMLGNFSIGDYFKREAINFAWTFLTSPEYIGFEKERMYVTVHPDDTEAYDIWVNEMGVDPSHVCKTEHNFWQIGEGPCGPNTEMFYDRGEAYDPEHIGERLFFEDLDNDRYIEIWNVVFSQYDGKEGVDRKDYKELPQKNIDTGMGLERLACILQDGETNFDTDLFLPLIYATEKFTAIPYAENKMAYRVIADHIRTVTFALADGALFANEGRGYVLRRVLRRAVRFGKKLKIEGAFMYQLVPVVYEIMKDFYPYIGEKIEYIQKLVKAEEERFQTTLSDGERLMNEVIASTKDKVISGETAFKLYDTYGFPFELTVEMAKESGFEVDKEGFDKEMEKQRERARNSREALESMNSQSADLMNFTEASSFTGYEESVCHSKVIACFVDGHKVEVIEDEGDVILDETCFYAESGGQVADTGVLLNGAMKAKVLDVKKAPHKQHLHHVKLINGTIKCGDDVTGQIDGEKRKEITCNHSACHLLQSALKEVVGSHIAQAGSFVSDEYLRFDFTHFEKVSEEQLKQVEDLVNQYIAQKNQVVIENLNIEDAHKTGATALFDEKYGDVVRVVSMGDVSKEFCGGCHVHNTQEIGVFKIDSEESIGSGVRRIVAKSGYAAYKEFIAIENNLREIAAMLKLNGLSNVVSKSAQMLDELNAIKKENAALNASMLVLKADELAKNAVEVNGINMLVERFDNVDGNALKEMVSTLRDKTDGVVFIGGSNDGKVVFVSGASQKAVKAGFHCGNLVKEAALICDGKGGGRPDLAQAGGKSDEKLDEALQDVKNKLGLLL